MRKILIQLLPLPLLISLLGGCSVYKIDIQQGNTLESDKIAQLKPGMTKQQVNFLLGTPLVQDPFHPERWDYVYSFTPGGGRINKQHLTLYFKNDRLATIDQSALTGYERPPRPSKK